MSSPKVFRSKGFSVLNDISEHPFSDSIAFSTKAECYYQKSLEVKDFQFWMIISEYAFSSACDFLQKLNVIAKSI